MFKLYSNENFPFPVVVELRRFGYDVLTTQDTGQAGQAISDEMILAFAHTEERVLLTFNRKHFIRLHLQEVKHSGIITCTFDPDFSGLANRIHEALAKQTHLTGHLIRVNRPGPTSSKDPS